MMPLIEKSEEEALMRFFLLSFRQPSKQEERPYKNFPKVLDSIMHLAYNVCTLNGVHADKTSE